MSPALPTGGLQRDFRETCFPRDPAPQPRPPQAPPLLGVDRTAHGGVGWRLLVPERLQSPSAHGFACLTGTLIPLCGYTGDRGVSSQIFVCPEPQDATLFGKMVFTDTQVIKAA